MAKNVGKRLQVTNPGLGEDPAGVKLNQMRIAFTVQEFCLAIGLGKTTVNALIRDGSLRSFRVRGRRLIPATEYVDFPNRMSGE